MALPLWQRQNNSDEYDVEELVNYFFTRARKVYGTKSISLTSLMVEANAEYQITIGNEGIGIMLYEQWSMKYLTWNEVKDNVPESGLKYGTLTLSPDRVKNLIHGYDKISVNVDGWVKNFSLIFKCIFEQRKYTRYTFFFLMDAAGVQLFNLHPENPAVRSMEQYLDELNKYVEKTQTIQRVFNIVQTYVMLTALGGIPAAQRALPTSITENMPVAVGIVDDVVKLLGPVFEQAQKLKDDLFTIKGLVNTGLTVAADTVKDQLNIIRTDILKDLQALDDSTILNLSSVTESVARSTRDVVDNVDSIIFNTFDLVKAIIEGHGKAIDKALEEPTSGERAELEKVNLSNGIGFALGLKRLFFTKKVKP